MHFLQKNEVEYHGIVFVGCTLWTKVTDDEKAHFARSVSDYKHIKRDGDKLSVDQSNELFDDHVAYIRDRIEHYENTGKKLVVVTHHSPVIRFHQKRAVRNAAHYPHKIDGIDLTALVEGKNNVEAWLFGHTHHSSSQIIHGTRFCSNQQGYNGENDGVFRVDFHLKLTEEDLKDEIYQKRGHY